MIIALRVRNALAAGIAGLIDRGDGPGVIEFYDGERPPNADIAVTRQRRLARVAFARPGFSRAEGGRVTAYALAPSNALLTGRVSWARISDGDANALLDLDVGAANSGAALTTSTTQMVAHSPVVIDDFSVSVPAR